MEPEYDSADGPRYPLPKCSTGIAGLDEITGGGLPKGRPTLVCGGPGCGKTVLAMEFLVRGALEHGEPGLFVSFEESPEDLCSNFASLGFDLKTLIEKNLFCILYAKPSQEEIVETGEFSLDGLFIRLEQGISRVGAKRVVLDTLEVLFSVLSNTRILRGEIAHLFGWLKEKGVSSVITAERSSGELTRHGFEEYVSDCVILLDHRVNEQISKRRLRIVKYRGSAHSKDEYPFLIGEQGFSVLPITSVKLDYQVGSERTTTGVPDLDEMLDGLGLYRGSSTMITGAAGTGKTTLGAAFAAATCQRGESCLLFTFEESVGQLIRNMKTAGVDLQPWIDKGLLHIQAARPSLYGLEEHLIAILNEVQKHQPKAVVIDPITNFLGVGAVAEIKSMLTRALDQLRSTNTTILLLSLVAEDSDVYSSDTEISSLMDTWISVNRQRTGNTYRNQLHIIKSRGMDHSRDVLELRFSAEGISLRPLGDGDKHSQGGNK